MNRRCKPRLTAPAVLAFLALLAGCPRPQHVATPPPAAPPALPAPPATAPAPAAVYAVAPEDSLLIVRVYRGGALASYGHNHVIASHDLAGSFRVPADAAGASFDVRFPVAGLTVDEPALRAAEDSADFPPQVPESAREGTRRNMLGESLLDAARFPDIVLRGAGLQPDGVGGATARIETTVRGTTHAVTVTVRCQLAGDTLRAEGDLVLRQSELGLTPYSALLGALQVEDAMRISFRILARASATSGPAPPAPPSPRTPCAAPRS